MEEILLKTLEGLMHLTGVDKETAMDILSMYLKQTETLLGEIQLAAEMSPPKWGEIKNMFHKLKGSSGNVRQELLFELSIMGETASKHENFNGLLEVLSKAQTLHRKLSECLKSEMCSR